MPKLREVASAEELMQLLESSNILRPDELRRAKEMAQETTNCQLLARRLIALDVITRWQAGQLLVGWTKLRLGKYLLRSQIGRGEFGRVFLARHTQLEREVAIKTLSRRFTQHPEIVERFLADARKVAALDHRNILHVYDIDSDDDQFYLVMEYVQGVDLQHRVEQQGPLAVDVAARLLGQAAAGLAHAHERGRSPSEPAAGSSLMLDEQGSVKIVGLGMGRLAAMRRTLAAAEAGQPEPADRSAYAAPEQRQITNAVTSQSDIYALGCIAYYGLTGQAPPPARSGRGASSSPAADDSRYRRTASRYSGRTGSRDSDDDGPRYAGSLRLGCGGGAAPCGPGWWTWRTMCRSPRRPTSEASGEDSFDWLPKITQPSRKSRSAVVPKRGDSSVSVTAGRPAQRSLQGVYAAVALISHRAVCGIVLLADEARSRSLRADPKRPAALGSPGRTRVRDRGDKTRGAADASTPPAEAAPAAAESPTVPQPAAADADRRGIGGRRYSTDYRVHAHSRTPRRRQPRRVQRTAGGEKKPAVSPADTPANKEPPLPPRRHLPRRADSTPAPDPPVNPFGELPAAIDLPSVEQDATVPASTEPFDLGKLDLAPSAPVNQCPCSADSWRARAAPFRGVGELGNRSN